MKDERNESEGRGSTEKASGVESVICKEKRDENYTRKEGKARKNVKGKKG